MSDTVYLDYNATAPMRACASEILVRVLDETGNASSVHTAGRAARAHVETAREQVAHALGARASEVIFTGGGTEANNLALRGTGRAQILVSAIEHPSVLDAPDGPTLVDATRDGVVDLKALESTLSEGQAPALISIMTANNETGIIQPLAEAVEIARRYDALIHTDGIQAVGKVDVNFAALDVDMMSVSAHKLGGPQGVGALIVREGLELESLLRGGGQERRHRAGTENVAGIAAFGAAIEDAVGGLESFAAIAALRDDLETEIAALAPDACFFGQSASRLPNTSCFGVPGLASETQVISMDLAGVMISAGSACSSGKVEPSHVLEAMGAADDTAAGAVRISLGWNTDATDVERFVAVWSELYGRSKTAPAEGRAA